MPHGDFVGLEDRDLSQRLFTEGFGKSGERVTEQIEG